MCVLFLLLLLLLLLLLFSFPFYYHYHRLYSSITLSHPVLQDGPLRSNFVSIAGSNLHKGCLFLHMGPLLTSQLAFYVNLHRAVIGPSATLTGRWRPDIDLRRMLTGLLIQRTVNCINTMPTKDAYSEPKKLSPRERGMNPESLASEASVLTTALSCSIHWILPPWRRSE